MAETTQTAATDSPEPELAEMLETALPDFDAGEIRAQLPEQLRQFWDIVVEVWRFGVFGVDFGAVIAAFLIFGFFLLIRQLFTAIVINRLKRLAAETETTIDDDLLLAVKNPVRFIPVVMGLFFAFQALPLSAELAAFTGRLIRSLVAFNLFWFLYAAVRVLATGISRIRTALTPEMIDWLIKALKAAIILLGAATVLEIWGIAIGPLIAGLGLFGVAVALGAQDLFKNLISGVLILTERRFHKGDWILVDGVVEGIVETIGFRSTLVRRFDKAPVFVPNAQLSDTVVTNFSRMTHRRIYWFIGVEYRTTIDQLREIRDGIEAYIMQSADFAKPPVVPTFVRIDKFGASSIDIMIYCFTKSTVWGDWLEIKEKMAYRIKEIVEGAGTGFAFPSQSVYLESLPEGAEAFVPPGEAAPETEPEDRR